MELFDDVILFKGSLAELNEVSKDKFKIARVQMFSGGWGTTVEEIKKAIVNTCNVNAWAGFIYAIEDTEDRHSRLSGQPITWDD